MIRKLAITLAALGITLSLFASLAAASSQDKAKEEADAYKAWYDVQKDIPKAFGFAKNYLEKFPNGQYATYLKRWVVGARGALFNEARRAKNIAEEIKIGGEALAEDPENLDYLYLLAIDIRAVELFANPPNYAHAGEATDFNLRAIKLIEAGKIPSIVTDKSKWNQNQIVSLLHQNLGVIEGGKNKNTDKALEHYKKASALDPSNAYNFLACGSLYQAKYGAAVQKYQAFPDADRTAAEPKPEVKAALDEVNSAADAVIDCWAHFMALTATKNDFGQTREQVEKALTELYKFRHPDSADGLQKLIDQYKSTNSSSAPTSAAASRP